MKIHKICLWTGIALLFTAGGLWLNDLQNSSHRHEDAALTSPRATTVLVLRKGQTTHAVLYSNILDCWDKRSLSKDCVTEPIKNSVAISEPTKTQVPIELNWTVLFVEADNGHRTAILYKNFFNCWDARDLLQQVPGNYAECSSVSFRGD